MGLSKSDVVFRVSTLTATYAALLYSLFFVYIRRVEKRNLDFNVGRLGADREPTDPLCRKTTSTVHRELREAHADDDRRVEKSNTEVRRQALEFLVVVVVSLLAVAACALLFAKDRGGLIKRTAVDHFVSTLGVTLTYVAFTELVAAKMPYLPKLTTKGLRAVGKSAVDRLPSHGTGAMSKAWRTLESA